MEFIPRQLSLFLDITIANYVLHNYSCYMPASILGSYEGGG